MDSVKQILESGILEEYLIGGLSKKEISKVEGYIEQYPEVKAYFQTLQETLWNMAEDMSIPPPPSIKEKLLEEIEQKSSSGKKSIFSNSFLFLLPWVISLFAIGAFIGNNMKNKKAINELKAENKQLLEDCKNRNQQNIAKLEQYQLLQDSNTELVLLSNLNKNFEALAYTNKKKSSLILNLADLSAPPEGMCYQMWGDYKGEMINIGVLDLERNYVLEPLKLNPNFASINVTLEDLGVDGKGSDHATVENLLASASI